MAFAFSPNSSHTWGLRRDLYGVHVDHDLCHALFREISHHAPEIRCRMMGSASWLDMYLTKPELFCLSTMQDKSDLSLTAVQVPSDERQPLARWRVSVETTVMAAAGHRKMLEGCHSQIRARLSMLIDLSLTQSLASMFIDSLDGVKTPILEGIRDGSDTFEKLTSGAATGAPSFRDLAEKEWAKLKEAEREQWVQLRAAELEAEATAKIKAELESASEEEDLKTLEDIARRRRLRAGSSSASSSLASASVDFDFSLSDAVGHAASSRAAAWVSISSAAAEPSSEGRPVGL